jgi:hypothetical protein
MPDYRDGEEAVVINREATLLDTGVLVARFSKAEPDENKKYHAEFVMENPDAYDLGPQWIVPSVVLVEAWGWMSGSKYKDRDGQQAMMSWLRDPGNRVSVVRCSSAFARTHQLVTTHGIDVVDAFIFDLAVTVSRECSLSPFLRIATFDTRDLTRLRIAENQDVRVFDMNSLHSV